MARRVIPLTDTTIRAAKASGDGGIRKLSDGDGLQLWVMPSGGKLWRRGTIPARSRRPPLAARAAGDRTFGALGAMLIEKKRREHRAAIVSGEEHVVHGFRSTASTLLNDNTLFSADATEKELAHQHVDAVRRA